MYEEYIFTEENIVKITSDISQQRFRTILVTTSNFPPQQKQETNGEADITVE